MHQESEKLDHLHHSFAHLLAAAVLELHPTAKPTIGPAVENGFYYDFDFPEPIAEGDLKVIEARMRKILLTWEGFKRHEVNAKEARKEFAGNPYKLELIDELEKAGENITVYQSGEFRDLCRGGHVEDVKEMKADAFTLSKLAGAYWRGSEKNKQLTRIYGLAFKNKKALDAHLAMLREAEKRDHRKLGAELDLFVISPLIGPGLPLFTPRGTVVRNEIKKLSWELESGIGYEEVATPNMNKAELFKLSGHYEKFRDSMFRVVSNYTDEEYFLKPMNCPHATQIYAAKSRSWRDLPIRLADFANLYRDEKPGELMGLTRVRYFSQDDSHCFCREDQIEEEMSNIFTIIKKMMDIYGLESWIRLSLRDPEVQSEYLGAEAVWEKAEKTMTSFLKRHDIPHEAIEGEAAFYGPKMDLMARTAIGTKWQLATIQLDYIMPERFDLTYTDAKGKAARPAMIHKAMAGSLERFLGILIEHYAGAFPLWLAPEQVRILNVGAKHEEAALKLATEMKVAGIRATADLANETVPKKIRTAANLKIPSTIVLGDKELESGKLAVRNRGSKDIRLVEKDAFLQEVRDKIATRAA